MFQTVDVVLYSYDVRLRTSCRIKRDYGERGNSLACPASMGFGSTATSARPTDEYPEPDLSCRPLIFFLQLIMLTRIIELCLQLNSAVLSFQLSLHQFSSLLIAYSKLGGEAYISTCVLILAQGNQWPPLEREFHSIISVLYHFE